MERITTHNRFNPYTDNGGTTVAIAGEDYCIVAGDTRQSEGYSINSRYAPKTFKLTDKCVYAANGFHADAVNLVKQLSARVEMYNHQHDKSISTPAIANMLFRTLYYRRFFPYYVFSIVGGLNAQGKGVVYSFDPVGSYEECGYRAGGSAAPSIQPFLDNQVGYKNLTYPRVSTPLDKAIKLVQDAFTAAAERDIYTGDYLEIHIIKKDGITTQVFDLKKD